MSKFGIRIKNYQADSVWGVQCGTRSNYDTTDAMLTNSLFSDFLKENGLKIHKNGSTRDVICMKFDYDTRSYENELKHFDKMLANDKYTPEQLERISYLKDEASANAEKYVAMSKDDLRIEFYKNGVDILYPIFNKNKEITGYDTIHYLMLYRTVGKAKKGECMFICQRLYKRARDFLYMGTKLPKKDAKIVEMGAYSSLSTSTIIDKIKIEPHQILFLKDVKSYFKTNIVSVEINDQDRCVAVDKSDYTLSNELFDGQALIDKSIFPEYGNGYVLLRHHFTKMAAFCTSIQLFFKDYYGDAYEAATITDMFGNEIKASDIKLITTNNAIKWLKMGITYSHWTEWVHKNDCQFGVVKTAHESKLGKYQRMSYQMVNVMDIDDMGGVLKTTQDYIYDLKNDINTYLDYLHRNNNFSNDYEVLIALYKQNNDFQYCDYFKNRRKKIINNYIKDLKGGHILQEADNLTIVGSPYAMLLHSVGEDVESDPTFEQEDDCMQVFTNRFTDGEYLAVFRSPFNSANNLGYCHNHYHEYFHKYFDLGRLCIAVNMIHTPWQDRSNGADQDSDSVYTTNQPNIVARAKYCYANYPTIVNNIGMDANHYTSDLEDFARVDNILAAAQTEIGESSNLAQLCLTYTYSEENKIYQDYACVLAVLAQAAIDQSKRRFNVNIASEIINIKKEIKVDENQYPEFWELELKEKKANKRDLWCAKHIRTSNTKKTEKWDKLLKEPRSEKMNEDLVCPMNTAYNMEFPRANDYTTTLPIGNFFIMHRMPDIKKVSKKIEGLIEKYSLELMNYNTSDDTDSENYLLLRNDFEILIEDIRKIAMPEKYVYIFAWLLNRAFMISPYVVAKADSMVTKINKNKSLLLKVLYEVNPETLLMCFKKHEKI